MRPAEHQGALDSVTGKQEIDTGNLAPPANSTALAGVRTACNYSMIIDALKADVLAARPSVNFRTGAKMPLEREPV